MREGDDVRAYNIGGVRFVPLVGGGQSGGEYEDRFGSISPIGPKPQLG